MEREQEQFEEMVKLIGAGLRAAGDPLSYRVALEHLMCLSKVLLEISKAGAVR